MQARRKSRGREEWKGKETDVAGSRGGALVGRGKQLSMREAHEQVFLLPGSARAHQNAQKR